MSLPVALVTGVGPDGGTGAEIAKRFAVGGYRTAMLARDADRLAALEAGIENATAFPCDVGDLDALKATVAAVREQLGPPRIVVHNALRSTRGPLLEQDPEDLERNFRVNRRTQARTDGVAAPRPRDPSRHAGGGRRRATRHRQHFGHAR